MIASNTLRAGIAGCAIAAAATLTSVAPAQAAPVAAPAAPVILGTGFLGSHDLLSKFKPLHGWVFQPHKIFKWGCYGHHK